jgi:hypothetical protein
MGSGLTPDIWAGTFEVGIGDFPKTLGLRDLQSGIVHWKSDVHFLMVDRLRSEWMHLNHCFVCEILSLAQPRSGSEFQPK